MKYRILILLLFAFNFSFSQNDMDQNEIENIQKLIKLFQTKNADGISKIIKYPLKREYPIPDVKNEVDFRKRFNQIFDQKIIDEISNSKMDRSWLAWNYAQ